MHASLDQNDNKLFDENDFVNYINIFTKEKNILNIVIQFLLFNQR